MGSSYTVTNMIVIKIYIIINFKVYETNRNIYKLV